VRAAAQKQAERFLCGRCELMDELETAMPAWLRRRHAAQWNPAWVHFLQARARVSPALCSAWFCWLQQLRLGIKSCFAFLEHWPCPNAGTLAWFAHPDVGDQRMTLRASPLRRGLLAALPL